MMKPDTGLISLSLTVVLIRLQEIFHFLVVDLGKNSLKKTFEVIFTHDCLGKL